jgi:cyanophycinase-like exopeptidase
MPPAQRAHKPPKDRRHSQGSFRNRTEHGSVCHRRVLGIGIDQDTAAIVDGDTFTVIGSGAVYVVDGEEVTHSNVAEASPERVL